MGPGAFLAGLIAATTLPSAIAPASQPQWLTQPSGEDIARFYPPKARERVLSGRAVVTCVIISMTGRLDACKVVQEVPLGYGFGEAAVQVAGRYLARPQVPADARAVVGKTVDIPVSFTVEGWVDLSCAVDGSGRASRCRATSEHPPGRGFGALYARAAEGAAYDPKTFRRSGETVLTTVRFPVPIDPAPDS